MGVKGINQLALATKLNFVNAAHHLCKKTIAHPILKKMIKVDFETLPKTNYFLLLLRHLGLIQITH
jgi:hypothetical protein